VLWLRGVAKYYLRDFAGAEADFTQALAYRRNTWYLLRDRGDAFAAMGRVREAVDDFTQALRGSGPPELLHARGVALMRLREHRAAHDDFEKSARMAPTSDHLASLAESLNALGRAEEAVEICGRVLAKEPDHDRTLNARAQAYLRLGKAGLAVEDYDRLLQKNRRPEMRSNRGWALVQAGRVDEGIRDFRQCLLENPRLTFAHHALGCALAGKGEFAAAEAEFTEAIKLGNPESLVFRSRTRLEQNNLEGAKADLDDLLRGQDDASARVDRARLRYRLWSKAPSEATLPEMRKAMREDIEQALKLDPQHPYVLENAGHFYMIEEEYGKAVEVWRAAIMRDPGVRARVAALLAEAEKKK